MKRVPILQALSITVALLSLAEWTHLGLVTPVVKTIHADFRADPLILTGLIRTSCRSIGRGVSRLESCLRRSSLPKTDGAHVASLRSSI